MNEEVIKPRYGIDPYLDWVKAEGIPVAEDYGIYLFDVETKPWPRFGVKAPPAISRAAATSPTCSCSRFRPAARPTPQRHLYEEVIYVLEGTG